MTAADRIILDLTQHHETTGDKSAFLLSPTGHAADARWIPKSLCERLADGKFAIDRAKALEVGFLVPPSTKQMRLPL